MCGFTQHEAKVDAIRKGVSVATVNWIGHEGGREMPVVFAVLGSDLTRASPDSVLLPLTSMML